MSNYENRIVLFLDILGFKRIIEDTELKGEEDVKKTSFLIETIEEMKEAVRAISKGTTKNVTQFSDSIVVSFVENDIKEIPKLFLDLQRLIAKLLARGILCRGAVSYGKLYHSNGLVFGPALVDAYETESQAALYPRIILDQSVLDVMKHHYSFESKHSYRKIRFDSDVNSYLKTDSDDKFYIDYFTGSMQFFENEELFRVYSKLRKIIIDGLRIKNPGVKIKYNWMKNKYNKLPELLKRLDEDEELFYGRPDIEKFYKEFKPINTTANNS
ncbi:hypothetical protein [Pontibacter pudoricolor]|uniref:hypothetical protein n=1 Tax=Pontibacter pudoricolor TaxID=2694930 RepID=UPI00139163CF|nr:hypothetical protein [Pontibacter pudoricolor]